MTELRYYLAGIALVMMVFLAIYGVVLLWEKFSRAFPILFIGMWILILGVAAGQALMEAGL